MKVKSASTTRNSNPRLAAAVCAALHHGRVGAVSLALASSALAALAPSSALAADPAFVPGRILVVQKAGVDDVEFAKTLSAHGGRSLGKLYRLPVHVVSLPAGQDERDTIARLTRHPHVKSAELDVKLPSQMSTNDPYLPSEWHLTKIDAPAAWDKSTGAGVTIAILDSGVDATHPDLQGQLVPGWNFYNYNGDTSDVYGHGTKVAGTAAAAANNGTGVASVAFGVRIMPIRVTDTAGMGYASTISQGITWAADNGARVANVSFDAAGSSTVVSAAQYMYGKGGIVTMSAGNTGTQQAYTPSDYVLVVSGTDSNDALATWSSWGSYVDLAAPGAGIATTTKGGGYASVSGTSFSAPIVAGVAALVRAARPDFTAAQVQQALFKGAADLGTSGFDNLYGYGRVSASGALAAAASVPSDLTAPTASITSPKGGASVSGTTTTVGVSASDNVGVAKVELYVNGTLFATDATAPYSFVWDTTKVANGAATLQAKAYDLSGNVGASTLFSVTVNNPVVATDPPKVSLSGVSSGQTIGSKTLNLAAKASDSSGIAQLTISVDGAEVAGGSSGSLSYKWNPSNLAAGTHTVSAWALDKQGQSSRVDVVVTK